MTNAPPGEAGSDEADPGDAGHAELGGEFVQSLERGVSVTRAFDADPPLLSLSKRAAVPEESLG